MLMMLSVMAAMISSLIAIILVSPASAWSMALPGATSSGLSKWISLRITMLPLASRAIALSANNVDNIIITINLVFIISSVYCIYCANSLMVNPASRRCRQKAG